MQVAHDPRAAAARRAVLIEELRRANLCPQRPPPFRLLDALQVVLSNDWADAPMDVVDLLRSNVHGGSTLLDGLAQHVLTWALSEYWHAPTRGHVDIAMTLRPATLTETDVTIGLLLLLNAYDGVPTLASLRPWIESVLWSEEIDIVARLVRHIDDAGFFSRMPPLFCVLLNVPGSRLECVAAKVMASVRWESLVAGLKEVCERHDEDTMWTAAQSRFVDAIARRAVHEDFDILSAMPDDEGCASHVVARVRYLRRSAWLRAVAGYERAERGSEDDHTTGSGEMAAKWTRR